MKHENAILFEKIKISSDYTHAERALSFLAITIDNEHPPQK